MVGIPRLRGLKSTNRFPHYGYGTVTVTVLQLRLVNSKAQYSTVQIGLKGTQISNTTQ